MNGSMVFQPWNAFTSYKTKSKCCNWRRPTWSNHRTTVHYCYVKAQWSKFVCTYVRTYFLNLPSLQGMYVHNGPDLDPGLWNRWIPGSPKDKLCTMHKCSNLMHKCSFHCAMRVKHQGYILMYVCTHICTYKLQQILTQHSPHSHLFPLFH